MAAMASTFTVRSMFKIKENKFEKLLACVKCNDKENQAVMLQCFHLVCYGRKQDCLKLKEGENYTCKTCKNVTSHEYLYQKGVLDKNGNIYKIYDEYITRSRQMIMGEIYWGTSGWFASRRRSRHSTKMILCSNHGKEHSLCISNDMMVRIDAGPAEFFCCKDCAKRRAEELKMHFSIQKDDFGCDDWVKDWPVFSQKFKDSLAAYERKFASDGLDDDAKETVAEIYRNFCQLEKHVVCAFKTHLGLGHEEDRLTSILNLYTLENELEACCMEVQDTRKNLVAELRPTEMKQLHVLCSLGMHMIVQDLMLTWNCISEHKKYPEVVKRLLQVEPQRFIPSSYSASATCYKFNVLERNEKRLRRTRSNALIRTPIYHTRLGALCRNYRVMPDSPQVCYFPGVGTKQTPKQLSTDNTVQLLVQKQLCGCSVVQAVKDKGYYCGVARYLEKGRSELQSSLMWTMKLDKSLPTCIKISEKFFVKSSWDHHLRLTMDDDRDLPEFDLFRDTNDQRFGRGIWFFDEDDTRCTVFALQVGTRNIVQFDLTAEFPNTNPSTRPSHFARKATHQLESSEMDRRNFNDKDTLALTGGLEGSPLAICVCFCPEDLGQRSPLDLTIYEVSETQLKMKRLPTAGLEGFFSPVILGISQNGRGFLILDEADCKWLHLYQQATHADLDAAETCTCLQAWKIQIQKTENEAMDILDAFIVSKEDKLLLHVCAPARPFPAENIKEREYFQLDITELMNPLQRESVPIMPGSSRTTPSAKTTGACSDP